MKDLQGLSDRELLLLTLQEQRRLRKELEPIKVLVEKHEKFKNTLVGAMATSLLTSIASFIGYLRTIGGQ